MSYNSTIMYICECGNVFDDYETYENMPRYGKERKPMIDRNGKKVYDKDGNQVFMKCHHCRKTGAPQAMLNSKSSTEQMLDYMMENDYVTSLMYEQFGFSSRRSFTSCVHKYVQAGVVTPINDHKRPQKYKIADKDADVSLDKTIT